MNLTLVKIRLLQLRREIGLLGFFYTLFFASLAAGLITALFYQYQQRPNSWAAAGILVALATAIQIGRTDKEFIFRQLPHPRHAIFAEYLVMSLPLTLPCLFTENWYCFLVVAAGFLAVSGLRVHVSGKHTLLPGISRFTGSKNFEWISGTRKSFPALVMVYLLAIGLCWVPVLPLFFLWVVTVIATSFYQESEPLPILLSCGGTPSAILKSKIIQGCKLLLVLQLPVLVLAAILNPQLWYIYVVFPALQLVLLTSAVLVKYNSYEPNRKLSPNLLLTSLSALGVLAPALLPFPLFICFRFWGKAKERLHFYTDD